jgi:hypothetical protein
MSDPINRAAVRLFQRWPNPNWLDNPATRKLYLPTWQQLVELNLLREEAARLTGR